jgi:hypothetical protein
MIQSKRETQQGNDLSLLGFAFLNKTYSDSIVLGQHDAAKFKSLIGFDAPVWHDRFMKDGIIYIDSESPINSSEIGKTEISTVEKTFFDSSILEIRASEVGSTKPRLSDKDIFE